MRIVKKKVEVYSGIKPIEKLQPKINVYTS